MSGIKQLAGQTVWYGLSNIGGRFLNYLTTPIITYLVGSRAGQAEMGTFQVLYVYIALLNIVFTYGFETAYFRFSNKEGISQRSLFQTAFTSHIISTIGFIFLISLFRVPIGNFIGVSGHYEYILWCLAIIGFDTLCVIPLAKLRKDSRPKKYAFVNLAGIAVYIFLTIYFLAYLPETAAKSTGWLHNWFSQQTKTGLLLKANLAQALVTFLLLFKEWRTLRFEFEKSLWKQLWRYSSPMIIGGLAGMVNEVFDRQMLEKLYNGSTEESKIQVAIYGYCYKLSIFITLFISAFKMAAEPFFFNKSQDKDALKVYARVMKWFVITLSVAFLFTALFLDIWKFVVGPAYRSGMGVVPVLLAANLCLGIYYNLSIWYKLADKMRIGMYITLFGAAITFFGNYYFIPRFGYYACAWTTFSCYFIMMLICYKLGQKLFPIPYNVKKITAYLVAMLLLYFIHVGVGALTSVLVIRVLAGAVLMGLFLMLVLFAEKKELERMPFIGNYVVKLMERKSVARG